MGARPVTQAAGERHRIRVFQGEVANYFDLKKSM